MSDPGHVWVDGTIMPADGRHLSAYDRGFQLGDGIFETLRARAGRPVELGEHLARLDRSALGVAIPLPSNVSARLEQAKSEFGLENCRIIGARLESVESFPAAVITARAFAPLGKLLNLSARFSTQATAWLLPKGRSAAQELQAQPKAIQAMFHVKQSQTDPGGGILVGKGAPELQ